MEIGKNSFLELELKLELSAIILPFADIGWRTVCQRPYQSAGAAANVLDRRSRSPRLLSQHGASVAPFLTLWLDVGIIAPRSRPLRAYLPAHYLYSRQPVRYGC